MKAELEIIPPLDQIVVHPSVMAALRARGDVDLTDYVEGRAYPLGPEHNPYSIEAERIVNAA